MNPGGGLAGSAVMERRMLQAHVGGARRSWPSWLLAATVVVTAACASAQARLERGLTRAGVPSPVATCMATHMADRLSTGQLRRIGSLRRLDDDIAAGLTLERFLDDIRALRDPEILAVTSGAAVVCWVTRPPGARQ
jgi:hypothetical protein